YGGVFLQRALGHQVADDDRSRGDADFRLEPRAFGLRSRQQRCHASFRPRHLRDDSQRRPHRAFRGVLEGARGAEAGENAVAVVLEPETVIAIEGRLAYGPKSLVDGAQVFRVETRRKIGGADQIAIHDREMAALAAATLLRAGRRLWARLARAQRPDGV